MIKVGSIVKVKAPFGEFFPEEYEIVGVSETGAFQIPGPDGNIDFDETFLEEVI